MQIPLLGRHHMPIGSEACVRPRQRVRSGWDDPVAQNFAHRADTCDDYQGVLSTTAQTMDIERSHFVSSAISDAEIVLAVVAPTGTRVDSVEEMLRDRLEHFQYNLESIRLSDLIATFPGLKTPVRDSPHGARIRSRMDAGNELRQRRADVLALAAINDIRARRVEKNGELQRPSARTAYFLRSLKHPDEVRTLREVYGSGFVLLGISSSRESRLEYLRDDKNVAEEEARTLLDRDESEEEGYGQQTRKAFEMADVFIALGRESDGNKRQLWRLLDLLFGQTFLTPTVEEHAMFLAYATSLRSADLSRQVGAVILSASGEVIATGANEVPRAGGGQYWTDGYCDWPRERPPNDQRDWVKGVDSNAERREKIVVDFTERLAKIAREEATTALESGLPEGAERDALIHKARDWRPAAADLERALRGALVMDLTEFGRAVHAEMEALLCCSRVGVSPRRGRLFSTTFPCHNCSKHILAAGISEVFYIEPYPKSLAVELHGDALVLAPAESHHDTREAKDERAIFRAFSGVGPRRFLDLFSLGLGTGRAIKRKGNLPQDGWRRSAQLRLSMVPTSYLEREDGAVAALNRVKEPET